jgi:predicted RNA-binding protein Jag
MKSILHEAPTILKAIEKAWLDSGKPLEFTVHVHEEGEKNFLGISKRPAIVSITYEPKAYEPRRQPKAPEKREQPSFARGQRPQPERGKRDQRTDVRPKREFPEKTYQQPQPQPYQQQQQMQQQRQRQPMAQQQQFSQEEFWTNELVNDIQIWFKEMITLLGITTAYDHKTDRRMLQLIFQDAVLPTADDERQLFIGMSYLLIQFLKKKYKKKLRGYHLVITTKNYAAQDRNN